MLHFGALPGFEDFIELLYCRGVDILIVLNEGISLLGYMVNLYVPLPFQTTDLHPVQTTQALHCIILNVHLSTILLQLHSTLLSASYRYFVKS